MEHLEAFALWIRKNCFNEKFRRHAVWGLAGISLLGSLVKEQWPLPDSYFNNKKNVLNVYFVKVSWGWTFLSLLPFIALTSYVATRSLGTVFRRLSALLVGTMVWFTCTQFFMMIENYTGTCYNSSMVPEIRPEHTDKRSCVTSGGFWDGFDISGHSFLLPYCTLMILEETAVVHIVRFEKSWQKHLINALTLSLAFLVFVWVFMFFCTAIYFHNFFQKLLGTSFGILGWYVTYRRWYLTPYSPGLPPRSAAKEGKRGYSK
ncbi:acyl-coenzyme A diphosphatase FITM2 [Bufo gargarizans]|uniref:acyl-coenzyme A diphosphatase FITM2 n=1 Tax=Bufo gargarizans TaxID=30331 RepID=UPI001CF3C559|nr:acyl-coenzyme A diphosphatase FITM2 [Bufo gargarizans]